MDPREELESVRSLDLRINAKLREIERLESMINRCTPVLKQDVVQSSGADRVDSISKLIELRDQANHMIDDYCDLIASINLKLDQIDDPLLAEILTERYLDGWGWSRIAGGLHYEKRQIYRAHDKALREYEKLSPNVTRCH